MTANDRRRPRWPARVLKTFGVLHVVFAVFGLYLLLGLAGFYVSSPDVIKTRATELPFRTEAYLLRTGINLAFLGAAAIAGFHLLRTRLSGIAISNVLYAAMLAYFLFPIWDLFGPAFSRAMGATAGTGDVGITPQLITGYPVLALILLNLASRSMRRFQESSNAASLMTETRFSPN